jgi:hypothetical protein
VTSIHRGDGREERFKMAITRTRLGDQFCFKVLQNSDPTYPLAALDKKEGPVTISGQKLCLGNLCVVFKDQLFSMMGYSYNLTNKADVEPAPGGTPYRVCLDFVLNGTTPTQ